MGRTIVSNRLTVKNLAEQWSRTAMTLRKDNQKYGEELERMVQQHGSEGFCAFEGAIESAMFSVLVEVMRQCDGMHVDP